jgi:hypothetical protein
MPGVRKGQTFGRLEYPRALNKANTGERATRGRRRPSGIAIHSVRSIGFPAGCRTNRERDDTQGETGVRAMGIRAAIAEEKSKPSVIEGFA